MAAQFLQSPLHSFQLRNQIVLRSRCSPVLRVHQRNGRDAWDTRFPILTDTFQRVAECGNQYTFQNVVGAAKPQIQVCLHNRAAKALHVLLAALGNLRSSPQADGQKTTGIHHLLRRIQRKTAHRIPSGTAHPALCGPDAPRPGTGRPIPYSKPACPFSSLLFCWTISTRDWILVSNCAIEKALGSV